VDALERFVTAQDRDDSFESAMAELRAGAKRGHWIWWVFPQLAGLGRSPASEYYGIADAAEARAYLAHPVLGPRLREAVSALLAHEGRSAAGLVGHDDVKLRSCLTLFGAVAPGDDLFSGALSRLFDGADPATLEMLARGAPPGRPRGQLETP
jgi:uncharacterized protein (DUF1810 family)